MVKRSISGGSDWVSGVSCDFDKLKAKIIHTKNIKVKTRNFTNFTNMFFLFIVIICFFIFLNISTPNSVYISNSPKVKWT
ncbi:MAG: hypothetical protein QXJ14_02010 [Candidatus Aenigmatarchaeota archaeon]